MLFLCNKSYGGHFGLLFLLKENGMEMLSGIIVAHNLADILCGCTRRKDNLIGSEFFVEDETFASGHLFYDGKKYALFVNNKDSGAPEALLYEKFEGTKIDLKERFKISSPVKYIEVIHSIVTNCPYCSVTEESYDL